MLEELIEWLKEIAIFMVMCEMLLSFSPTTVYRRYIKLFVGLILLLRITSFLFGAVDVNWELRIAEIFADYEQSVDRYLEHVPIMEQEDKLADRLTQITEEYDVDVEESLQNRYILEENEILNDDITNISDIIISPIEIGE